MTYNIVVDGIFIAWGRLIFEMVGCAVNAEHEIFLERPSGNIARKLFISGLLSAERKEREESELGRRCENYRKARRTKEVFC